MFRRRFSIIPKPCSRKGCGNMSYIGFVVEDRNNVMHPFTVCADCRSRYDAVLVQTGIAYIIKFIPKENIL